jgi:membrane-bound lytic murein transglycosylase B
MRQGIVRPLACWHRSAAQAAPCRTSGTYEAWLAAFEREAMAQGISQRTIAAAAPSLTYDQHIVNIDRGQRVFTQTFLEFSGRMAAAYRIQRGQALIKANAPTFARIEQQYGVPAPVIVSFWALESDFGANMGKYHSLSAIASLAYDCRRGDKFRAQLLDALRLIERGDLAAGRDDRLLGRRARPDADDAVGIFQIRRRLRRRRQAQSHSQRPRRARVDGELSAWARLEARRALAQRSARAGEHAMGSGRPFDFAPARQMGRLRRHASPTAARLPPTIFPPRSCLPMGRLGPAFLAYQNFQIYLQWNNSLVYSTTAAYLATRIAGAPALIRGSPPPALPVQGRQGHAGHAGARRL